MKEPTDPAEVLNEDRLVEPQLLQSESAIRCGKTRSSRQRCWVARNQPKHDENQNGDDSDEEKARGQAMQEEPGEPAVHPTVIARFSVTENPPAQSSSSTVSLLRDGGICESSIALDIDPYSLDVARDGNWIAGVQHHDAWDLFAE